MRFRGYVVAATAAVAGVALVTVAQEFKSGIVWPEPPIITPGPTAADPPSDAVVLFDGKDLSKWERGENWEIKDGYAISRKSNIKTKEKFGTCQLHVEFATPSTVVGRGQGRGNNGVFIMGRYEVQILDSFDNKTYFDGQCASIYKQSPPMVNACRKPGEWQTYDIVFEAPKFADDGKVERPAYMTVLHNGVLVHNHFELLGGTFYDKPPSYTKHADREPLELYYHGNDVRFRNIWLREIKPIEGKKPG
jgi:hypothetical protein